MNAEKQLSKQGVFKGHDGLRRLSECGEFWSKQPYGTRFYFGPGGGDYLHRGVLQSAIKALDEIGTPEKGHKPRSNDVST